MRLPDQQLAFLQLLLDSLEAYLQSPQMFWPLELAAGLRSGTPSRLSLGVLALTLDALAAQELSLPAAQRRDQLQLTRQWEGHRLTWRVAVERKATLESRARLNLWSAYLDELDEAEAAGQDYPHEVRQRVMVARLNSWSGTGPETDRNAERTRSLDARLKGKFETGPFVWEASLEPVYPAPEFWYLYGRPSKRGAAYLA
jgi:hypothetical protein